MEMKLAWKPMVKDLISLCPTLQCDLKQVILPVCPSVSAKCEILYLFTHSKNTKMPAQPGCDGKKKNKTKSGIRRSRFKSLFAQGPVSHPEQSSFPC